MSDRATVVQVLTEYGLSGGGELHSWRCQHPDMYGPCDCLEQLANEILVRLSPVADTTEDHR